MRQVSDEFARVIEVLAVSGSPMLGDKKAMSRLKKQLYNRDRLRAKRLYYECEVASLREEATCLENVSQKLAYLKRSILSWQDISNAFERERLLSERQNNELKIQVRTNNDIILKFMSMASARAIENYPNS
jgi:hypothetical protein